ncbi:hypothetical protein RSOLAG1IB_12575 [Rhizoctonia solani AG-1 IB]|uniref:Reverse transcriptase domain-containing protein n=1 Tax=Thanatephorus cucumeris (strain AG1-IB / isolate 7/3/14) TaxID=1108050 RepID=A0A0B7FXW8_THACB|nr:hypothetical protein RSOLAG1IB_12575 [Rhizoctonia solani AG-1 IB]
MVSQVMQQGDCNAGATYQQLMNHLFSAHIGVFMYVYLDDIIIFSNTIEEHVSHIRTILNILEREKFYLSPKKMQFFTKEINLLGHVINEKGIKMDPHKVDSIEKWKTPTTKEQIASYIGALGYLAPNCKGIRQPMAILSKCASGTGRFCWEGTQERAFNKTKQIVVKHRDTHAQHFTPIFLRAVRLEKVSESGLKVLVQAPARWQPGCQRISPWITSDSSWQDVDNEEKMIRTGIQLTGSIWKFED